MGHCLTFTPETISEYFEETETGFSQVVAFRARNSVERRSYLPIGHGNFDASGFVEVESDGLPVDDLFAMQEMADEFGGLGVFTYLGAYGSDGRFYGFSMYYEGHPVCSDVALSFVVDGVTGQVVACYDYMMEAQTSLVFVASEDSFVSDDFALPNATWPVEWDTCGVRLDGEHPEEFFRIVTGPGLFESDDRDGAGT